MEIAPVTLVGTHVHLVPLLRQHATELWQQADEPAIWSYMPYGDINSPERMAWLVDEMLRRQAAGNDLCFAQLEPISQKPIGMTRYMTIERANKNLEIGGTWLGKAFRRTLINTEAKFLMLRHAFETLGAIRVQLRTDMRNERSQRAIERIGAVREGVWRDHIIMPDGYVRSSVYYSVLADEWAAVKTRLQVLLGSA